MLKFIYGAIKPYTTRAFIRWKILDIASLECKMFSARNFAGHAACYVAAT